MLVVSAFSSSTGRSGMSVAKTTVDKLLKGYDIRLRPDFGGKLCNHTWVVGSTVEGIDALLDQNWDMLICSSYHSEIWQSFGPQWNIALIYGVTLSFHLLKMAAPWESIWPLTGEIKHFILQNTSCALNIFTYCHVATAASCASLLELMRQTKKVMHNCEVGGKW